MYEAFFLKLVLIPLTFLTLRGSQYYHCHFTEEDTEA